MGTFLAVLGLLLGVPIALALLIVYLTYFEWIAGLLINKLHKKDNNERKV